jgi:hypothetical protein
VETGKSQAVTGPGSTADASKLDKVLFDRQQCAVVVQNKLAISFPFFQMFPSHCIPKATGDSC